MDVTPVIVLFLSSPLASTVIVLQPPIMASSMSMRSYSMSRQPSFSSRSLMDTGRARSRASVSFAAASPLSRSASISQDVNGPMSLQLNGVHGNSTNDKEAMQSLNNRLANYLDKVWCIKQHRIVKLLVSSQKGLSPVAS